MEVKSAGTFPVILLKLVTPPLPPQTKLNLELCSKWRLAPAYGLSPAQFYPIRSQYTHNLQQPSQQPDLLQRNFEREW